MNIESLKILLERKFNEGIETKVTATMSDIASKGSYDNAILTQYRTNMINYIKEGTNAEIAGIKDNVESANKSNDGNLMNKYYKEYVSDGKITQIVEEKCNEFMNQNEIN